MAIAIRAGSPYVKPADFEKWLKPLEIE